MGENLATKSLGGVGGFYQWLLHNNGTDPAIGFMLTLGNGTELPLWIDEDGVSLVNAAGKKLALRHNLTADATLTLEKDQPKAILLADFSNSTTTAAAVPSFSLNLEADKTYKISGMMVCTSTATTRGLQLALTGPSASVDWMHFEMSLLEDTTLATSIIKSQRKTSFDSFIAFATAPAASSPYITHVKGMLKTNGVTPASVVGLETKSSAATFAAVLKAGSWLKFEEI